MATDRRCDPLSSVQMVAVGVAGTNLTAIGAGWRKLMIMLPRLLILH